ncbi:MAG: M13 family metallopeptidase, partial [Bdellovibrionota bacterium]
EKELVEGEVAKIRGITTREQLLQLLSDRIDTADRSFVSFDRDANQDDPNKWDAMFDLDLMGLPERSYYSKPEVVADYRGVLSALFKTAGLDHPEDRAESVVELEKSFAQKYPLPAEFRERYTQKNDVSRADLLKNYPALKLDRILTRIPAGANLRNLIPEAMEFTNTALKTAPLEQLKNTLLAHSIIGYMDDAYPEFFKKRFEFNRKNLGGPEKRPVREERCTRLVMSSFAREIDAELLPVLFPDFPREKIIALAAKIRESIIQGLKANTWLSPEGRQGAIKKMTSAKLLLVQPNSDEEWDFTPTAEYTSTRQYSNMRLLHKNLIEKHLAELSKPRLRTRWMMGPLTINAYYMPTDNIFVLPIGILQYPFYDPKLPEKTNLAAIGSVIGHELGHGIDDQGAKFDEEGRLKAWMTEKDVGEFRARGGRFVERFEKIGHNGKLTLGENIGDHVGLTFAHQAAFGGAKKPDRDSERAFFTQYARSWCQVMRPKYREMLLKTDPHAAGEARVNEQVRHQAGFQDAFSCKKGDPMFLPEAERIRVW